MISTFFDLHSYFPKKHIAVHSPRNANNDKCFPRIPTWLLVPTIFRLVSLIFAIKRVVIACSCPHRKNVFVTIILNTFYIIFFLLMGHVVQFLSSAQCSTPFSKSFFVWVKQTEPHEIHAYSSFIFSVIPFRPSCWTADLPYVCHPFLSVIIRLLQLLTLFHVRKQDKNANRLF